MGKSVKHSILFFILFCVQCIAFALIVAGIGGNVWWTPTKDSIKEKGLWENKDILGFSGDNKGTDNYFIVFFSFFLFSHYSETYLEPCQLSMTEIELFNKIFV